MRSLAINVSVSLSVCMPVCLSARISQKPHVQTILRKPSTPLYGTAWVIVMEEKQT